MKRSMNYLLSLFLFVLSVLAGTLMVAFKMAIIVTAAALERVVPGGLGMLSPAIVDTTTYLGDAKVIYGALQDQVSTEAMVINLFGDGAKFSKQTNIGIRGFTFGARLKPNWNLGFRKEGTGGVGTAGNQGIQQATVNLKYAYVPITITGQAENLTKGDAKAFMQAKALEAKFDMKDIISHVNVIVSGCERGGELARVTAAGAGTFTADNAGNLPGALFLRPGQVVDAAPVGGGALSLTAQTINTVNYATRAVAHTGGAATNGHAVALTSEYPTAVGDFPITCECLISLISDTTAVQGLNPATAGQEAWQSYLKDMAAADLSPANIQQLRQFVKNRGGENVDTFLLSSAQINKLVSVATATIRFNTDTGGMGKKAVDLGFSVFEYAGIPLIEDKDMRADRIYAGASDMMKKFEAIPLSMAEDEAGSWTRVSGASGIADAVSGLLRWYFQLGIVQRTAWGVHKNYAVPADFLTTAPTIG